MKKRKIICVLLATMLIFLCSCGDDTDMATETLQVDTTETTTEITSEENILNTETEIYNDNNVVISISDIIVDGTHVSVNLIFENNSDNDYDFYLESYSVNSIKGDTSYGTPTTSVNAGNKAKDTLYIYQEWLDENDISEIATIGFYFLAYDEEFEVNVDTGALLVQTNLYDETDIYTPTGEQIYSDTYMTIWETSSNDNVINLTLLNNSSTNAEFTIENCSVNGWTYEITDYTYDYCIEPIMVDTYALIKIEVDETFLADCGIDNVENFTFSIEMYKYDSITGEYIFRDTADKITVDLE